MRFIKKIIKAIILIALIFSIFIVFKGYMMYKNAINEISLDEKIHEIRNSENYTKIIDLPKDYLNAVIAVEDHRFYDHNGVDFISIGRAIINNIAQGRIAQGGSTITQQVIKNMYFTQEKKLERKIAELFVVYSIEKSYEKDDILELYVNTSYFGDGYYGIKEASNGYFDKEPMDMSLSECTLIAGIPNAPSVYAPTKNPDLANQRQKIVIQRMLENKYITKENANKLLNNLN